MSAETAVRARLGNVSAVTSLVPLTSIFASVPDDDQAAPYIKINRVFAEPQRGFGQWAADGTLRVRMQIDCYSYTAAEVHSIRTAVINALDGFEGVLDSTRVVAIRFLNELAEIFHDRTQVYRRALEFSVWVEE